MEQTREKREGLRNFRHGSDKYKVATHWTDVVKTVQIVTPPGKAFRCAMCGETDIDREYLRIYMKTAPTTLCVHSRCLTDLLQKGREAHERPLQWGSPISSFRNEKARRGSRDE